MSTANPICRVCGAELNDDNWSPSCQKRNGHICKKCAVERARSWTKEHPEEYRARLTMNNRKQGHRPFSENKECALFLGVHIAERILSKVFKNVKRMPMNNPGYDFICNRGKKIDVKCSCLRNDREYQKWNFGINKNTITDFFLCLAFDDRETLTPLYMWLIPGSAVSYLKSASISPSTIHKWDEYRLDVSKISTCCGVMRRD